MRVRPCMRKRQQQQFEFDFVAVFDSSNNACDGSDVFIEDGGQQFRDLLAARTRSRAS